jgi:hypothetical protein
VLVNESENYLLTTLDEGQYNQNSLSWLTGKKVRKIVGTRHSFLLICCSDYDDDLDIMSSTIQKFKL